MLKKSVLAVVLLLVATNVWAVKTMGVSAGKHNLGTTSSSVSGQATGNPGDPGAEDEVCIFCHTPHGGTLDAPLWNRPLIRQDAGYEFTHYTSATLSTYMKTTLSSTRPMNTESLLCMSCHDGYTAMNNIINASNRTGTPNNFDVMPPQWFGNNPVIGDPDGTAEVPAINAGRNLTDDHPISFSYYDASVQAVNDGKLWDADGDINNDPRTKGVRLFGADGVGGQRVECSSCHDPHVDYTATGDAAYTPFLATPNAASALCLACHIK